MEYIISTDNHPELHYSSSRHYDHIADARRDCPIGARIYRISERDDFGTPIYFTEVA